MTRATTMQAASEVRFNRFLAGVYLVMALGLAVTALVSSWVSTNEDLIRRIFYDPWFTFGLFIIQIIIVVTLSAAVMRFSPIVALLLFLGYNEQGQKVYKVNGKALRVRQTLIFEDAHGKELCKIQERMLRIKDSMEVEGPNGEQMAMVKKAMITPVRERWIVKIKSGPDLDVKGNILDHEYTIGEGRDKVAEVSKKWFRLRDSYGIEIEQGQDDILILAVAVCIDEMTHEGR